VTKHNNWLLSVLTIVSVSTISLPVKGQALLPYTLNLNAQELEDQGMGLLQEAVQLVQFRQYELAFPRAKLATQLAPNQYSSWFVLGTLYLQQEKFDEAIINLQRARNLQPREASIFFSLGNAYFQKEDYQTAISEIEAGLPLAENSPPVRDALFDLGNAHLMLKNYDLAIKNHDKSFQLDKTFWPAINNIGLIEYEQGNIEKAIKNWQESVNLDPEATEPMLALAVAFYIQGKQEEALKLAEKGLTIDGRYGDLDFLKKNLWGDRLLNDTKTFFSIPEIQPLLTRIQRQNQED
jgi:tetratricopeptide (TPR) repeat protein